MPRYIEHTAHAELMPYVAGYWLFDAGEEGRDLEPDFAWLEAHGSMLFSLADPPQGAGAACARPIAAGGVRLPHTLRLGARTRILGLRFKAGGMRLLFSLSPAEPRGVETVADSWEEELGEKLAELGPDKDEAAFRLAESALLARPKASSERRRRKLARSCQLCPFGPGSHIAAGVRLVSTRTMQRAWPEFGGYGPRDYVAVVRCELARNALCRQRSTGLTDLALELGFCDLPHLCKTFRRWTGHTPIGYARHVAPYRDCLGTRYSCVKPVGGEGAAQS
jgi:AraC-like DNA-binding protein